MKPISDLTLSTQSEQEFNNPVPEVDPLIRVMTAQAIEKDEMMERTNHQGRSARKLWDIFDMPGKLASVRGWVSQGASLAGIARLLGVSTNTVYKWRVMYPEFSEAVNWGRDIADGALVASAFRQAAGYTVNEQQAVRLSRITRGKREEYVEIVNVDRYVQPNAAVTIFLLKNRLPGEYKDKIDHSVMGNVTFNILQPARGQEEQPKQIADETNFIIEHMDGDADMADQEGTEFGDGE